MAEWPTVRGAGGQPTGSLNKRTGSSGILAKIDRIPSWLDLDLGSREPPPALIDLWQE